MRRQSILFHPATAVALLLAGVAVVIGSGFFSLISGVGEWFQRSGSLFVLFSVLVEIQQTAIKQPEASSGVTISGAPVAIRQPISALSKWLHRLAWGGIVTGTIIWGYGDLLF